MRQLVGETIGGRFEVLRLIGQGGMGMVFEVRQIALMRRCALKLLLPEVVNIPTVKQRFEREARLAAQVKHPNVVGILDTGTTSEGLPYIAMDFLDGESLDQTLTRERVLPWVRARHIVLQICSALAEAHSLGIVHRDLKPANCMRITLAGDPDFIKLVDFGIAKALWVDDMQTKLTQRDVPMGTVDYMAYEQACGSDDCDHRVDIWSVAVILFELLSGHLPFRGAQAGPVVQRLAAILTREPTLLSSYIPDGSVPPGVDEIIQRALRKDRAQRFQTIGEFRDALAVLPATVPGVSVTPVPAPDQESAELTEINPNDVIGLPSSTVDPVSPLTVTVLASPDPHADLPPLQPVTSDQQRSPRPSPRLLIGALLVLVAGLMLFFYTLSAPSPEPVAAVDPPLVVKSEPPTKNDPLSPADLLTKNGPPPVIDPPPTQVDLPPTKVEPSKIVPTPKVNKPPATSGISKREACVTLRSQLKAPIASCIGLQRTIPYGLKIAVDARGVVTSVGIDNPLLEDDEAYQCLQRAIVKNVLKQVVGPLSFTCTVRR